MSTRKFLPAFSTLVLFGGLSACASPDHIVASGVKDWCERDVHCGRTHSDPSQGPERTPASRDNPIGR